MLARVSPLAVFSALGFLAVASASPSAIQRDNPNDGQCNTGSIQCCNSVQSASGGVASILGLLGVVVQDVVGDIGITCNPVGGIGSGGSCNSQPVCCNGDNFNGVIVIGCSPINIVLYEKK